MAVKKESTVQVLIRPNWHPSMSQVLGDISGQYGYITEHGTVELLGPIHEDPEISEESLTTKNSSPTRLMSGSGALGL